MTLLYAFANRIFKHDVVCIPQIVERAFERKLGFHPVGAGGDLA
jgi:hypothetical protein